MARYLVEAHVLEGRLVSVLAAAHGVHRSWIYKLLARYREGGIQALEPRSRRPRSCKHGTPAQTIAAIVALRHQLAQEGHDAGAATIAYHLAQHTNGLPVPSLATIWRILKREGLIVPQPQKRPRCSLIRFEADLPNETWQTDITHWQLAAGEHAEILNFIDDHSRLFLASDAYPTTKAQDVVDSFHKAAALHGLPASLLSDNGAVFTANPPPRQGAAPVRAPAARDRIQELTALPPTDLRQDRAPTPNTKTLPRQTARRQQPPRATSPARHVPPLLQRHPPHRALEGRTPLQAYNTRIKAKPAASKPITHFRVRNDKVNAHSKVTLRYMSKLHHIGLGRAHKGRHVKLLIANQSIRVITPHGKLLRELTLNPSHDHQPLQHP
jgi:transposase